LPRPETASSPLPRPFISYGVSELIHCYGFFAVFDTAITLCSAHRDHEFQRDMHDITEQVERIAMMLLLWPSEAR
jgi:hypothetical protein